MGPDQQQQVVKEDVHQHFNDVNLSREREDGESFEDYKFRMKTNNSLIKNHLKGKLIWNSASLEYNMKKRKYVTVIQQGTRQGIDIC